jgi:predicted RNA-binding protein with PIN domain
MIIVVDGYNLLKNWRPHAAIDERERHAFLQKIAHYGRRKRHKMVVVFDGGLYEWPSKEKMGGITVIYSARESADEVIMQYLEDHKNKDILLVSSDHELNLFAADLNIVSIGSPEFAYLITEALKEGIDKEEIVIAIDESATDLDMIMEQATEEIPYKEDDKPRKEHIVSRSHRSKQDKVLLKKLKKL